MRPALQLKLSQHLILTSQLQQSIRLLQLSTLEMNQEIDRIAQENPLLELDDSAEYCSNQPDSQPTLPAADLSEPQGQFTINALAAENDTETKTNLIGEPDWFVDDSASRRTRDDNDEHEFPQQAVEPLSLREHLNLQISLSQVTECDRRIKGLLIDGLDDNSYLSQDVEKLVNLLPPELEIDFDDLHIAPEYLQHLDPPGIGARNLGKCLALQLRTLPEDTPCRDQARLLVSSYLESLTSRDFRLIKKLLHCDDDCLRSIQHLVTHLNPRPGPIFSAAVARYTIPDVIVTKIGGAWVASLNPEARPRLGINRFYASILKQSHDDSAQRLVSQLHKAKWLIKNVRQCFDTILRVSCAIVGRQRQFFEHGQSPWVR